MIKINLLPREIYAEEARRQIKAGAVAFVGVVVVGLLGYFAWCLHVKQRSEARLSEVQGELRKYQAIVDRVNELEQTRNQLRARRDVIKQLLVGRLTYPRFFEDFMAMLPSEIWISNLGTTLDPQGVMAVNISAQSLSNFAIADWLTSLQGSPLCSDIKLGSITTQEQEEGRAPLLAFSISFKYLRKDV